MKQILLFTATIFSICTSAQNFSVHATDSTFYGNITDNDFGSYFILYNDSTAAFPMSWSVETSNLDTGWEFSICDPNVCHPKGMSSGAFNLPTTTVNRIMNIHYYPNNNGGQSTVSVKLWEDQYPNEFVMLTWTGVIGAMSVDNEVSEYSMLTFPNPATNNIHIQYDLNTTSGENEVVLYDITGKKIESKVVSNAKGILQFSKDLNPGIYFYTLISNGQVIMTNKVILQ